MSLSQALNQFAQNLGRYRPYIFKKEDFEDLVTSPMLFARKFDQREDNVIITKLVMYLQNTKNDR